MPTPIAFHDHDHTSCQGGVLEYADECVREAVYA